MERDTFKYTLMLARDIKKKKKGNYYFYHR